MLLAEPIYFYETKECHLSLQEVMQLLQDGEVIY